MASEEHRAATAEKKSGLHGVVAAALFAALVFLGAFLLFLIEPMMGKVILPWFGGSASVWAVCLVFFQSTLLLGYLYADLTSRRLSPPAQAVLHIALLFACIAFLPVAPGQSWRPIPGEDPAFRILGLLCASIGLPFLLLSATSPLVQTWYARRLVSEPYHLFGVSNFASFLALLSYPLLIEPRTSTHSQLLAWSALFGIFLVVCSLAAWSSRSIPRISLPEESSAPVSRGRRLLWLACSSCGSMLLLSITNHLTQDVAPLPLLWVLPLALYLLTFAMAFHRRRLYSRWLVVRLLAVALGSMAYTLSDPRFLRNLQLATPLFCTGLFVCCLFCHGELYRLKPSPAQLTSYYLTIALGGALGAILVGLVAPHVFRNVYEFPVTLLLTALLAVPLLWREGRLTRVFWMAAPVGLGVALAYYVKDSREDAVFMTRSFYGVLTVKEASDDDEAPSARLLRNGTILHGEQFLSTELHMQPTTYYGRPSGIGFALEHCCRGPKRVGVIGLGAGTLAAYGKAGDLFRFYDINPQVVEVAQQWFTFLRDTPAKTAIALGDARLSLEREPSQQFDVLAVDAFSGDAIPVHLLTREAMLLYLRHLKPEGILAIHTSNAFLRLSAVAKQLADAAGYTAVIVYNEDDDAQRVFSSDWVLITRNQAFLEAVGTKGESIKVPPQLRLWTDDYSSLFRILRRIRWREAN